MSPTKTPTPAKAAAKKAAAPKPTAAKKPAAAAKPAPKKTTTTPAPAAPAPAKRPAKPSGLGKGIDALIPPATGDRADNVPLTAIHAATDNVRVDLGDLDDLADSIAVHGLLQPILVRQLAGAAGFEVIAGHRRRAALEQLAKAGRWAKDRLVPVSIRVDVDDRARLTAMLVENLHRADLNPIEEATGYFRLTTEFGMTQRDLAARVSRSQPHISQRIALLKLPAEVVDGIRTGKVGVDIAQRLTKLPDPVALKLTNKGTTNPTPYDIQAAENKLAADTAHSAFHKRLTDIGVEVLALKNTWDRPAGHTMTRSLARPAELDGIHGLEAGVDVAVLVPNTNAGNCRCDIYRPTVKPDITNLAADAVDDVVLSPHERETRAWEAERARLREEHQTAVAAHAVRERELLAAWAGQQNAKDVARWAMLALLRSGLIPGAWPRIDVVLGLPTASLDNGGRLALTNSEAVEAAVAAHAHENAGNLVAVCALLAREWDNPDTGETLTEPAESWTAFSADLGAPPALTLPSAPGMDQNDDEDLVAVSDDDLEDGEAEAIREAQRLAGDVDEEADLP